MDRASLRELREAWAIAVLFGDRARWKRAKPLPCWFGRCVPGIDECEGRIEGAHWIKRQRVRRWVEEQIEIPRSMFEYDPNWDLVHLAEWDPRNGVPACSKHHARFDGRRVDATNELVVWRHEVPAPVESFCRDWGLDVALEDRNPVIGDGV